MSPGAIESDRTERPLAPPPSVGRPHSGPGMRGNSTNITIINGTAWAMKRRPKRRVTRGDSAERGWLASISTEVIAVTHKPR